MTVINSIADYKAYLGRLLESKGYNENPELGDIVYTILLESFMHGTIYSNPDLILDVDEVNEL